MFRLIPPALALFLALPVLPACGGEPPAGRVIPPDVTVGRSIRDPGFANVGAVTHDGVADAYFVSNMNGDPLAEDANGFLSIVDGDGRLMALKYIDAQVLGIPLHAPKGIAVVDTILYVTDIHTIWRFNKETGDVIGSRRIPGATALHAIVPHPDLSVYFTDAGVRAGPGGVEPSGTDAVYRLRADGRLDTLAMGPELGRPTGIAVRNDSVWVVGGATGEVYRVENGRRVDVQRVADGLEGLALTDIGLFVTEPAAGTLWRAHPGQPFTRAVEGLVSPRAVAFDRWRFHFLIVTDGGTEIRAVPLGF